MSKSNSGHFKGTTGYNQILYSETNLDRDNINTNTKNKILQNTTQTKIIRIYFSYGCFPILLCNKNNNVIDELLPEEIRFNNRLISKFANLQSRYEALFINTENELTFIGFPSDEEKRKFLDDCQLALEDLIRILKGKYHLNNEINRIFD